MKLRNKTYKCFCLLEHYTPIVIEGLMYVICILILVL